MTLLLAEILTRLLIITESEVIHPGKYQTEAALTYRLSDSEVDTPKPKFDISRHNRTVEVSRLFIIWHFSAPDLNTG